MLVVTTTVGMVDGVHGNTTSTGPAVALGSELEIVNTANSRVNGGFTDLVLSTRRLQEGLVGTSTTGDDTNHTTAGAGEDLLGAGGELDTGLALIGVVANDGDIVSRGSSKGTTVSRLLLNVRNDSSFWDGAEGEDVSDGEVGVLAGVDELAGLHALVGDEGLGVKLVAVGVAEDDLGQRRTTAGVVDDLLHDTTDVAMALGKVESAELRRRLVKPFAKVLVIVSGVFDFVVLVISYWCWQ